MENPKEKGKNLVGVDGLLLGKKTNSRLGLDWFWGEEEERDYNHGYRGPKPLYPRPALTSKAVPN